MIAYLLRTVACWLVAFDDVQCLAADWGAMDDRPILDVAYANIETRVLRYLHATGQVGQYEAALGRCEPDDCCGG